MNIPRDIKTFDHLIATFWFDELGILHAVSKGGPRTIEIMENYITFVSNMIDHKPVCILTDISHATPMDKATRDYTADKLQKVFKAMAIISGTPVGLMVGKVFLQLDGQPYPSAIFNSEEEARKWLMQYL
jgi:hypothetical protein